MESCQPPPQIISRLESEKSQQVEFRCMIQDILGNEIYSCSNKLSDRTIFYCITIPGENDWVRRSASDDLNEFERSGEPDRLSVSLVNYSFPIPDGKNKSCLIKVYDVDLVDCLRVNDIVLVSGFVEPAGFDDHAELLTNKSSPQGEGDIQNTSNGTTATTPTNNNDNNNSNSNHSNHSNGNSNSVPKMKTVGGDLFKDQDFEPAKDFPEQFVPRIHVRTLKKLTHINPMLPTVIDRSKLDFDQLRLARARLSTILSELFGGDTLMTEYLIMSLISKIQRRKDVAVVGQLSMCFSGFKPEMSFLTEKLYEIISKITTHSHFIDMSLANLNNLRFTPEKDNENNKLIAGTLQLPDGLYLMLNEVALMPGLLTQQGTSNMKALGDIIQWQKHKYNFSYHSVEIDTDLKVLIVSEGKSILPVPVTVKIKNNDADSITSIRQACEAVDDFLPEDLLNMFRHYITTLTSFTDYDIPEEVSKFVADNFASWRQMDAENNRTLFSADDLNVRLTLARYLALSNAETTLTLETWKKVCQMETERLARLNSANA